MTITAPPAPDVRPLSGTIGAEIRGIDLRTIDDETVAAIRALWLDRKVVFFPDQHLTPEEHLAFAARFCQPTEGHPVIPGLEATQRSSRSTTPRPETSTPPTATFGPPVSGSAGTPT